MPEPQPVPKGLATIFGVVLSLGQYAGALALFLASSHDQAAIAALATATATAITTIAGRMYQAASAAAAPKPLPLEPINYGFALGKASTIHGETESFDVGEPDEQEATDGLGHTQSYGTSGDRVLAMDDPTDDPDPGPDPDYAEPHDLDDAGDGDELVDGGVSQVTTHANLKDD